MPIWLDGFAARHGPITAAPQDGGLSLRGTDDAQAILRGLLPWRPHPEDELLGSFTRHAGELPTVALVLVRRGGYAVGLARGEALLASKVGSRYVQSRTAAGGWSQQRYARRRQNQTDQLAEATCLAAQAVLSADPPPEVLVTGGDRRLVTSVLRDPRLASVRSLPCPRHLQVPDPRLAVLLAAASRSIAVEVSITDPASAHLTGGACG